MEAKRRSIQLLKQNLSPTQLEQYERRGHFEVIGGHSGLRYRIWHGYQTNVERLDRNGRRACSLCFMPQGHLPVGDIMLAQKIALELYENEAIRIANKMLPLEYFLDLELHRRNRWWPTLWSFLALAAVASAFSAARWRRPEVMVDELNQRFPRSTARQGRERAGMTAYPPTPKRPAGTFIVTEMLTPEEIKRLKRRAREMSARAKTQYPGLRIAKVRSRSVYLEPADGYVRKSNRRKKQDSASLDNSASPPDW
jgi:hypothetical protein